MVIEMVLMALNGVLRGDFWCEVFPFFKKLTKHSPQQGNWINLFAPCSTEMDYKGVKGFIAKSSLDWEVQATIDEVETVQDRWTTTSVFNGHHFQLSFLLVSLLAGCSILFIAYSSKHPYLLLLFCLLLHACM